MNKLNLPDGHPLDMIRVRNPLNAEYITRWSKQPFGIEAGGERIFLRYIAVKYAREVADKVIGIKAHKAKKSVIHFANERVDILNQVLIEVVQPYIQGECKENVPAEQSLQKGEAPINIGSRSLAQELGVSEKPPISSSKDVASNIINIKPPPGEALTDPMEIKKEKDKLRKRAKTLGINISKNLSLKKIKKAILEG